MTMRADKECDGSDSPREIELSGVDFISSLPDAILHHILSYIPTKFAIRTSVLSKRWKRVWYATPSISIDCNREDHLDSINETLTRYSPLKTTSFDVSISYGHGNITSYVDRWIKLPVFLNVENLSLKLESYYSFPDFFYINSSVKQLTLTLGLGLFPDLIPNCNVSWTSLRNLSLNRCNLPDESIANILSGCSMLQSLILNHCAKIHRLDLSRSVNLTRLEIISDRLLGPAEIVAPNIHYMRLTNFHKPPTLVDVSSLTEANLNLGYSQGYSVYGILEAGFLQDMMLKMLAKVQNIDNLTIGTVLLQILSLAELHGIPIPEFKIKALTVETMIVRSVIPGIIRLLQNSPRLKKITIYTTKCNAILDEVFERYLYTQSLNNNRCWSGFFPTVEETCSSFNDIAKDEKSVHVALFMDFVLWNAKTLETMVLRLGSYLNATEYRNLLSKVPKVSRNTNFRKGGQGKTILNSFKIIP